MALFHALFSTAALAHEYWIEPLKHHVTLGEKVLANLKNGENFQGISLPRIPEDLVTVSLHHRNGSRELAGRLGDFPALHYTPKHPGWQIVALQTKPKDLSYEKPGKFSAFITTHGLQEFSSQHPDLNDDAIVVEETYTRYAKTLLYVSSDDAASASASQNESTSAGELLWSKQDFKLEWVLVQRPARPAESASLALQLLFNGEPLASRQAEVFSKSGNTVKRTLQLTDESGQIEVALTPNVRYLINAVKAERSDSSQARINTDWASFTVQVNP